VIFTGGEGPPPEFIKRALKREVSLVIAADSGLEKAEEAGVRPDFIIGDMDSLDDLSRLGAYPPEKVIRHPQDKEYSDTELAIFFAREKGCDETWIMGGGGGRLDHLLSLYCLFERDFYPRRWMTEACDVWCMEAGRACYCLDLSAGSGSLVSVFPLGNGPWKALSTGLKWPLDAVEWKRGLFGLSNVALAENFSITAEDGRFLVITQLPANEK
jgi:thiamine pyrophosphokinase